MTPRSRIWRVATGSAVLLVLALLAARLLPLYLRNLQLQQYLEEITTQTENFQKPDDLLRVAILNKASDLELPVKASQVRIRRSGGQLQIDLFYLAPVDLALYTVDLHFRPSAGGR